MHVSSLLLNTSCGSSFLFLFLFVTYCYTYIPLGEGVRNKCDGVFRLVQKFQMTFPQKHEDFSFCYHLGPIPLIAH